MNFEKYDKYMINNTRRSDIDGTNVCYIWPAHDISMSLAYIGTSGRGVVAALVVFFIYVCKLYKHTKLLV
jgi:hypothetical protein